jgi:hypothetical protein
MSVLSSNPTWPFCIAMEKTLVDQIVQLPMLISATLLRDCPITGTEPVIRYRHNNSLSLRREQWKPT